MNSSDLRRDIIFSTENNEKLAELFGILFGDEYMEIYNFNHVVEIAGNSIKDKDYMEKYVSDLFKSLFNLQPNIYFRKK